MRTNRIDDEYSEFDLRGLMQARKFGIDIVCVGPVENVRIVADIRFSRGWRKDNLRRWRLPEATRRRQCDKDNQRYDSRDGSHEQIGPNGGVDRATALPSSLAGPRLMRKSLPVAPVQRFVGFASMSKHAWSD